VMFLFGGVCGVAVGGDDEPRSWVREHALGTRTRRQLGRASVLARNEVVVAIISSFDGNVHDAWATLMERFPSLSVEQVRNALACAGPSPVVRGNWLPAEDQSILDWVDLHGTDSWTSLARQMPGRLGKQCRERYISHLSPDLTFSPWTGGEDKILFQSFRQLGSKWETIRRLLPGRSANAVKNRWNFHLKRRVPSDGSDELLPVPVIRRGRPPSRLLVERPAPPAETDELSPGPVVCRRSPPAESTEISSASPDLPPPLLPLLPGGIASVSGASLFLDASFPLSDWSRTNCFFDDDGESSGDLSDLEPLLPSSSSAALSGDSNPDLSSISVLQ
jgi:hypothetical protein